MGLFDAFKGMFKDLAAGAEDPRLANPAYAARHDALIEELKTARARLASSRGQLESKVAEARAKLTELASSDANDPVSEQIGGMIEAELETLDQDIKDLIEEEHELEIAEKRLTTQAEALSARREALSAIQDAAETRIKAREELGGLPGELAGAGDALEQAERRTRDVQARATVIGELADLRAVQGGKAFSDPEAQRIATRYASTLKAEKSEVPKRQLDLGFRTLIELETEYRQVQAVLAKRRRTDPLSVSYVPSLADETYQQGLSVLGDAIDLLLAIRNPSQEELEANITDLEITLGSPAEDAESPAGVRARLAAETLESHRHRLAMLQRNQTHVDELVHQCQRCVAALNSTRLEIAALQAAGSKTSVDSVTTSLESTLKQAREVQEEMKRFGL